MLQKSSPAPFFKAFAEFCFLRHLFRLAASLACLKSDYYAVVSLGGGGGGGADTSSGRAPPTFYVQKIRLCGCFILQLALSLDGPYPRKMSEKREEVIVPAGRRYQQKQHELLPAAKGLNF